MVTQLLSLMSAFLTLWMGTSLSAPCDVPSVYSTVQAAIDDINCSAVIIAAGIFADPVTVDRTITIRGDSQASTYIEATIIINNNAVLTLEDMTVRRAGTGILLDSDSAELVTSNVTVTENSTGIAFSAAASSSQVTLSNCMIEYNGLGMQTRNLDMTNCAVHHNAPNGGIHITGSGGTIRNSGILSNSVTTPAGDGGGILIDGSSATLRVESSTIAHNISVGTSNSVNTSDGGGIMVRNGSLILTDSDVHDNQAARRGGGIAVHNLFNATASIIDSTIRDNLANDVGGGLSVGGNVVVQDSVIEGNRAERDELLNVDGIAFGGGVYVYAYRLRMFDSTVRDNVATVRFGSSTDPAGGGIYVATNEEVLIAYSTVRGNSADSDAGGLYISSGTQIFNTTISQNTAGNSGGGIYAAGGSIDNSTIVQNAADFDLNGSGSGGGIAGVASLNHTLIGLNFIRANPANTPNDCSGTGVQSMGYSLLRIGTGCPNFVQTTGDKVGTVNAPLQLGLIVPLTDNGGTTETIALTANSIAVDAGSADCNAQSLDQRRFTRLAQDGDNDGGTDGNQCDIGAFERQVGAPTAITLTQFQSPFILSSIAILLVTLVLTSLVWKVTRV